MVFGRDKRKESKSTKAAQYAQLPPPPMSRNVDPYQQRAPPYGNANAYPPKAPLAPVSRNVNPYQQGPPPSRSPNPYPPKAPPGQTYDPRYQSSASRPSTSSGAKYALASQPPPPMPPSQYSSPMPYRPARQQQPKAAIIKQVSPLPLMMPGMRYTQPTVRLFSKKVYEMKARREAWDRGLEEYLYARDNGLPYAGNPEYGDYVCRGPGSMRTDYQKQGRDGRRY